MAKTLYFEGAGNILHWRLFDGEATGDHEIDINGKTAAECIRAAMSWNVATYGDFSAAV